VVWCGVVWCGVTHRRAQVRTESSESPLWHTSSTCQFTKQNVRRVGSKSVPNQHILAIGVLVPAFAVTFSIPRGNTGSSLPLCFGSCRAPSPLLACLCEAEKGPNISTGRLNCALSVRKHSNVVSA
jgi:hypothetical protein